MRYFLAGLAVVVLGAAAPAEARTSTLACSASPFSKIELQAGGPMPFTATVEAGKELDVMNETDGALTITSSLLTASLQPGDCVAVVAGVGAYPYSISGYSTGDVSTWLYVIPAPVVTISQHASISYGQHTVLSGTAIGPAGTPVIVSARPLDASQPAQIGSVTPVRGTWTLSIAPKVGTEYTVDFGDAQDQRIVRVIPDLVARRKGHTVTVSVKARIARPTVWLFRYTPKALMLWTGVRSVTAGSNGLATFKNVPSGRYYAAVLGGDLYLDNGSEPFNIGR